MRLTQAQARALFSPTPVEGFDPQAQAEWDAGGLSPRQRAGFYECPRERFGEAMRRYRDQLHRVERVLRWRLAHPEPSASHVVEYVVPRSVKDPRSYREGRIVAVLRTYPSEFLAWREAQEAWEKLPKRKREATPAPAPLAHGYERHDRWMMTDYHGAQQTCPGCIAASAARKAWVEARADAYHKAGLETDDGPYKGQNARLWPDGSLSGEDIHYPPMPIASRVAVRITRAGWEKPAPATTKRPRKAA